ncbi:MAG: hypothetical protein LBR16_04960 [Treponema sp.]|jgi:DNA-directed RNA polymerase specialized sigma24 family protein|nr:hypothetical protein [Treponema sp.]
MDILQTISSLYSVFRSGELSRNDFEERLFYVLLHSGAGIRVCKEARERWPEFISWIYPRLGRSIDRYEERGLGFGPYLAVMIKWGAQEFIRIERQHRITEHSYWQARAEEMPACSTEYVKAEPECPEAAASPYTGIARRKVFMLLLKSYAYISEEFLDRIARAMRLDNWILVCLIAEIKDACRRREEAICALRELAQSHYYQWRSLQARLAEVLPGTPAYDCLRLRCERAWQQLVRVKARLSVKMRGAANREVARAIRMPKSTVDSALYTLRKKCGDAWGLSNFQFEKNTGLTKRQKKRGN